MILIDANSLIVLILGLIDPRIINTHKRTSIYDEQDFQNLIYAIGSFDRLIVLPNVWTEVDNLIGDYSGIRKDLYIQRIIGLMRQSSERYFTSLSGVGTYAFYDLGLTDSLLLVAAVDENCTMLITSDSSLSDHAISKGVRVFDLVKSRNARLDGSFNV